MSEEHCFCWPSGKTAIVVYLVNGEFSVSFFNRDGEFVHAIDSNRFRLQDPFDERSSTQQNRNEEVK